MAVDIYRRTAQDGLSLAELKLYHQIMAYRASQGLDPLPLSKSLTTTAGRHVLDVRENIWGEGLEPPRGANLHSWSDAPYYSDHRAPEAMWEAPARLGTGYDAPGYEITGAGYASSAAALDGWKASPAHDAILTESGAWARAGLAVIGIGLETAPGAGPYRGRVYDVWFGQEADPAGPPSIQGTGQADRITGTAFADRIFGRAGADRIDGGAGDDRLQGGAGNDVLSAGPGRDRLFGGAGADRLVAGPGRDVLTGGPGADTFVFNSPRAADGDRIADFRPGSDRIDLTAIDADTTRRGNQSFSLDPSGPLSFSQGVLAGDVDGDGRPDFEIALPGVRLLHAGDLLL